MSNLARSCLRMLLLYAVAAVAVGLVVYHRFPQPGPAIWAGIIAGFFIWLALAYLWAIPSNLVDWWRMRSGAAPRDGKRVAVIGTVHAATSSLHAPFSGTQCVAYSYKVISMKGESPSNDYEGFAMVPAYISTEQGQVKMLAYPELDMPDEPVRGAEAKQSAREFIESTQFMNVRKEGIKAAAEELKQLLADDDGSMRYDHRMDPVAESLDDCRLIERLVRAGDTVCALGKYSEERRAIVPDTGAIVHAATIKKGTPGSFRRGALRKAIGSAIGVVICSGLVAAAAVIFLVNVPMDASEQMNPNRRFLWEEVKLERWIDKNVRTPLAAAGTITAPGMYMLELCDHCAIGRFEANGRVIELRHASAWKNETTRVVHLAAAAGEKDGVTITFDRKARGKWTIDLTMNGTPYRVPEAWIQPNDVQDTYGSGEAITGRVTVIGPADNVRVRTAFKAPLEDRSASSDV